MIWAARGVFSLLCCISVTEAAVWVIPDVRNAADASGAAVATRLSMVNRGTEPVTVQLELIASAGSATPEPAFVELAPGARFFANDAATTLWATEQLAGTLRITSTQDLFLTAANVRTGAVISASVLPVVRLELAPQQEDLVQSIAAAQTSALSTTLSLTALLPGSSVELRVFDASGIELATRVIGDLAAETRVPLADLTSSELSTARVSIQVISGRVLPVLLVSATDGSSVGYALATPTSLLPSPVLLPAAGGEAVLLVGAMAGEAFDFKVTALSPAGEPVADPLTLKVPVDGLLEARDLPAGTLALEAIAPFSALLGNSLRQPLSLSGTGDRLTLPATGETTRLVVVGGTGGGAASVAVYDEAGSVIAQSAEPLSLTALQTVDQTLDSLFPGIVTTAARVELTVTQGSLGAQAALAAPDSADTLVYAGQPAAASECPEPRISFSAEPSELSAGKTLLSWTVRNADSIVVSGAPDQPQPMLGSLEVSPAQTTEYSLQAGGSCGAATALTTVYVGPPTLSSVEPASGQPGQEVRVRIANAESWSGVSGVVWTLADGRTVVGEVVASDAGSATLRVPMVLQEPDTTKQWTGQARINVDAAGSETSTVAFTVLPLSAAGDSVAGLRQAIEATAAASSEKLAGLLEAGAPPASIAPLQKALETELAQLRKALDDIAATGRAVISLNVPSVAVPQSATFTMTRQDLDLVWALFRNAQATGGAATLSPLALAKAAGGNRAASDGENWDILRDPTYKLCLSAMLNETRGVLERTAWDAFLDAMANMLATISDVTGLDKIPGAAFTKKMIEISSKPEYWCNLYPIKLVTFWARPFPNPIPGYDYRESGRQGPNLGTELYAMFKQVWTREQAADALVGALTDKIVDKSKEKMKKLSDNQKEALTRSLKKMLEDAYKAAHEQVAAVVETAGLSRVTQDRLVYKANLEHIEPDPKRNKPVILKRGDHEIGLEGLYENDPRYGLSGVVNPQKPRGGTIALRILRRPKHFFDPDSGSTYYEIKGNPPLFAYAPVSVISREKEVSITSYTVTSVNSRPAPVNPRTVITSDSSTWLQKSLSGTRNYSGDDCRSVQDCTRSSSASVSAKKTGPNTWTVHVNFKSVGQRFPSSQGATAAAVTLTAYNPRNLGNRQHIRITCTTTNTNAGPNSIDAGRTSAYCAGSVSSLDGGGGIDASVRADYGKTETKTQVFDLPKGFQATLGIEVAGDGNGSGSATLTIELLDK
jgi:hypothetical protein